MPNRIVDQTLVRECFEFEPSTGILTWKARPREHFPSARGWQHFNIRFAGKRAGHICSTHGYRMLKICCTQYRAHAIIWVYVFGYWPKEIDHANGNRSDNRLENLREVNRSGNAKNQRLHFDNKTGLHGVEWLLKGRPLHKWKVGIGHEGKQIHLGYFDNLLDAACARKSAEREYGYNINHGRRS